MTHVPEERAVSIFVVPLFQIVVGVFLFIALLYRFTEMILFTGILLGMGIGAYIWTCLSPLKVSCGLRMDRLKGFPGETLRLSIRIINDKCLPVKATVALGLANPSIRSSRGEGRLDAACRLLWHQGCRLQRGVTFARRGVYRLGPPDLVTGDLFGFYRRKKETSSAAEVVIYPRIRQVTPVPLPRQDLYGAPGAKGLVEDPAYLYGIRDYQPGRPVRRIHWKASARYHRMQEKVCEPAQQEKTMLLFEVDGFAEAAAAEAFEETIETIASYAAWLDRRGHALGLACNSVLAGGRSPVVPIARGTGQLARLLEALARLTMEPEGDLLDILSRARSLPWGVSCLLFCHESCRSVDLIDAGLRQRKVPVSVLYGAATASPSDGQHQGVDNGRGQADASPGEGLVP